MDPIQEKHFSFKCPMSWDEMEPTATGRFCGKCRKEVFDLTNCSVGEVVALQRKHGSICGSIRVMQSAAVALSLSAAACQNVTPGNTEAAVAGDQPAGGQRLAGTPLAPDRLEREIRTRDSESRPPRVLSKIKAADPANGSGAGKKE